jgi:apolipoprotein N-acyltransferase
MASVAERPAARAVSAAVALIASAVLFFLGTGLHPVWWVTWLAPLPVLLLAPRASARTTGSVAALAQLLGMSGYAHYALAVLGVPVPLVAAICVVAAAVFAVVALEFRTLLMRGHTLLAVLGAGATWAAAEYLVAVLTPTGSNWTIANSQADNLPVLQIVSLTGPWGVAFVLLTTTAALAALTAPSTTGTGRRRAGAVGMLVLAMTLAYGLVRLAPAPAETVRVSVVAAPTVHDQPAADSPAGEALLAADLDWVRTEAKRGQVVVFPEKDIHVEDATLPGVVARFAAAARERDVVLVLGVEHRSGAHLYNTALTFPRDGSAPLVYHKRYPVPGVEDAVTPGTAPGFLPGGDGRGGVAICADMGQVSLGREYGRAGVGLMAVPALDFYVDAWAQSRVQLLRGVENGFSVARAARQGYLTLSDDHGRVLAQAASSVSDRTAAVTADLRSTGGGTAYSRAGDWFAWLCLLLSSAALAAAVTPPRPTPHRSRNPVSPHRAASGPSPSPPRRTWRSGRRRRRTGRGAVGASRAES